MDMYTENVENGDIKSSNNVDNNIISKKNILLLISAFVLGIFFDVLFL